MAFEGVKNVLRKFRSQPSKEKELHVSGGEASFEAGRNLRQFPHWRPQPRLANEDIRLSRKAAIARSRDLIYNNPSAASALRVSRNAVCGRGWRLSLKPDYVSLGISQEQAEEFAKKAERLFNTMAQSPSCPFDVSRSMTFDSIIKSVYSGYFTNGDAFGIMRWERSHMGTHTCVQLADPLRVETPTEYEHNIDVRDGIKIDDNGKPTHYYIQDPSYKRELKHYKSDNFKEVKAETSTGRKIMLHVFKADYAEQMRGMPQLTPSMRILKQIDQYISNENDRMALQASFPMKVKSNEDHATIMEVIGQNATATTNNMEKYVGALQDLHENMAPHVEHIRDHFSSNSGAQVIALTANEDLEVIQGHNHVDTFEGYAKVSQKAFSSGVGVDYATSHNDMSDTSYSAARVGHGNAWENYKEHKKIIEEKFALPFMQCVMEELIDIGLLEMPEGVDDFHLAKDFLLKGNFISSGIPFIDPLKERKAQEVALALGVTTLEEVCASEGKDYEQVLMQLKREKDLREELGLVLTAEEIANQQQDQQEINEGSDEAE